jgi:hypothetical protein
MRSMLFTLVALGSALVLGGAADLNSQPGSSKTVFGNAPIGHLQPHAQSFSPGSNGEKVEQERMSTFDAEQRRLDEQLDKSLKICRC